MYEQNINCNFQSCAYGCIKKQFCEYLKKISVKPPEQTKSSKPPKPSKPSNRTNPIVQTKQTIQPKPQKNLIKIEPLRLVEHREPPQIKIIKTKKKWYPMVVQPRTLEKFDDDVFPTVNIETQVMMYNQTVDLYNQFIDMLNDHFYYITHSNEEFIRSIGLYQNFEINLEKNFNKVKLRSYTVYPIKEIMILLDLMKSNIEQMRYFIDEIHKSILKYEIPDPDMVEKEIEQIFKSKTLEMAGGGQLDDLKDKIIQIQDKLKEFRKYDITGIEKYVKPTNSDLIKIDTGEKKYTPVRIDFESITIPNNVINGVKEEFKQKLNMRVNIKKEDIINNFITSSNKLTIVDHINNLNQIKQTYQAKFDIIETEKNKLYNLTKIPYGPNEFNFSYTKESSGYDDVIKRDELINKKTWTEEKIRRIDELLGIYDEELKEQINNVKNNYRNIGIIINDSTTMSDYLKYSFVWNLKQTPIAYTAKYKETIANIEKNLTNIANYKTKSMSDKITIPFITNYINENLKKSNNKNIEERLNSLKKCVEYLDYKNSTQASVNIGFREVADLNVFFKNNLEVSLNLLNFVGQNGPVISKLEQNQQIYEENEEKIKNFNNVINFIKLNNVQILFTKIDKFDKDYNNTPLTDPLKPELLEQLRSATMSELENIKTNISNLEITIKNKFQILPQLNYNIITQTIKTMNTHINNLSQSGGTIETIELDSKLPIDNQTKFIEEMKDNHANLDDNILKLLNLVHFIRTAEQNYNNTLNSLTSLKLNVKDFVLVLKKILELYTNEEISAYDLILTKEMIDSIIKKNKTKNNLNEILRLRINNFNSLLESLYEKMPDETVLIIDQSKKSFLDLLLVVNHHTF